MRFWTTHPSLWDRQALLAVWKEALQYARPILAGTAKPHNPYRRHAQLQRFLACSAPLEALDSYLAVVQEEAQSRGYNFKKVEFTSRSEKTVTTYGQLHYELTYLRHKMKNRKKGIDYARVDLIELWLNGLNRHDLASAAHPMCALSFDPNPASWERVKEF